MPGPLSWFFHHLPKPFHRVEVAANHFTQLVVPVLLFTPQPIATAAASLMVLTQLWLVLSGNFAWLNWTTIVLALSAIEFPTTPPRTWQGRPSGTRSWSSRSRRAWRPSSDRPARNLVSRRQVMNRSFDLLHLVNTYGAFGSVSRVRHEVVVEGTADPVPREDSEWKEYEFKGKPGDPRHWPRQYAPYHLRLDWLMWFAALSPRTPPPGSRAWSNGFWRTTGTHYGCCAAVHSRRTPHPVRPRPPLPLPLHDLA